MHKLEGQHKPASAVSFDRHTEQSHDRLSSHSECAAEPDLEHNSRSTVASGRKTTCTVGIWDPLAKGQRA